jgi:hypothetical protein
MLDPMGGFAGVSDALDGELMNVGGTRGLNPLEIKPTPDHGLDSVEDLDPWGEQIRWVMTFFGAVFERVADHPIGERSQTLRRATQEATRRQGITRDPETHAKESRTIRDFIVVLDSFVDDPGEFGYATEGEKQTVREEAETVSEPDAGRASRGSSGVADADV